MSHQQSLSDLIRDFAQSSTDHLWLVADDVYFDLDEPGFFAAFEACEVDLLSTLITTTSGDELTMMLSLCRISRSAARALQGAVDLRGDAPLETVLPTLARRAQLSVEEIGGDGPFTPPERSYRHYDARTWRPTGPIEHVGGKLHHPVATHGQSLAPDRISTGVRSQPAKILYVSPVGGAAAELLPAALACFKRAGADCLLLHYDDADLDLPEDARVVRDTGHKWQLARRHLLPDSLSGYDFIFFWDEDLDVKAFDPRRFVEIMQTNRLEMAQPAIESTQGLSHAITARRPCPPPWRADGGDPTYAVVGRLTNFVEIMAPVFSSRAWQEIYHYLDPTSVSGWGYDYVPMGRKGIVDAMPVEHTRPVGSPGSDPAAELDRFLASQGLVMFPHVDQGWLLERSTPNAAWGGDSTSRIFVNGQRFRAIRA